MRITNEQLSDIGKSVVIAYQNAPKERGPEGYGTDHIAAGRVALEMCSEILLNTPETEDFDKGVPLEAEHQIERWGADHDAGKNPEDWFWLVGYLAGKALAAHKAGNEEKAKHHCISTAAVMRNWHKHISLGKSSMRPGISAEKVQNLE